MISASSSRAVAMITGVRVTARSILSASDPSRSGRPRSSTITSPGSRVASRRAVNAVPALRTLCPNSDNWRITVVRMSGSSSTSSTRAIVWQPNGLTAVSQWMIAGGSASVRWPERSGASVSKRALYAVLAWAAATATAMAVVWAGLNSVLSTATGGPHVADIAAWPVQDAATSPAGSPAARSSAPAPATSAAPSRSRPAGGASSAPAKPSTSPSAPAQEQDGVQRRYSTPGGTVVLDIGQTKATLVAATPAAGFTVQSWQTEGFVEVEFSPADAGTAYEVIATWAGTSPTVQTVTAGA